MAEYIEKDKVIETVKQLYKDIINGKKKGCDFFDMCVDMCVDLCRNIEGIPCAEVAEIVLCKDCDNIKENSFDEDGTAWCPCVQDRVEPNDCCWPQKREDINNG